MLVESINLINFRNHSRYHLDLKPDTTLILGENGCGKTSVLEAIYILTRGKSFRATDPDIVKRGTEFYRIVLKYDNGIEVAATYDGKVKTFKTVEKSARRLPAKYKYPVILFEPHDLNLVGGPPSRRRDYFDRIFGDLSEEYATNLSKFNKALRQRNELLKSETLSPADLFAWNLLLSDYGSSIANVRAELSNLINKSLDSTYHSIAENNDHVSLSYSPVKSSLTKEIYLSELERSFERDHIIGYTTFGIQRDTFDFIFNEKMADGSASRGETRSIILALKFVEAGLLASHSSEKPLILLDDVFSELDDTRRHALVENFKNHQVVITSVEDVKI